MRGVAPKAKVISTTVFAFSGLIQALKETVTNKTNIVTHSIDIPLWRDDRTGHSQS